VAKNWGRIGGIAGVASFVVGAAALGFTRWQLSLGTIALTKIGEIRGDRSCVGFLINDELPTNFKTTPLDEDDKKRLEEKIECYRDQIEKNPRDAIAFTNRGEAERRLGKLKEALLDQKKALQLNPDLQEAKIGLSLVEGDLGNPKAASQAIQDALKQKETAIAFFYQGFVLGEQKDWQGAVTAYQKSISLNPNFADAYYKLGVALRNQDKLEEAITAYQKAISLKPNFANAYTSLGATLRDQGKLEGAITAYQKAISLKPDFADTYNNLGVALRFQGKLEEAITAFRKAISLSPNYAGVYYNLGLALNRQGKLQEAITAHQKAISLNPCLTDKTVWA